MNRWQRWTIVAAATTITMLAPFVVSSMWASPSSVGATDLLSRIRQSARVEFSGYAEAGGRLALPVTTRFNSINDLFGGTTDLRVWWRSDADWRVDAVDAFGETDLHQDAEGSWTWNYESNTATRATAPAAPIVRLPRADDLVPSTLARRLLSQADAAQLSRLPTARIAGHDAAGLRLRTADGRSTIEAVDVWALPSSGLPVRVRIYAHGDATPVFATSLLDLSTSAPSAATTSFTPPRGAKVHDSATGDIVAATDQLRGSSPPTELAGLPAQRAPRLGAVGVYGRGITMLVALPLRPDLADSIAAQLPASGGAVSTDAAITVDVGPINLLLTRAGRDGARWLLVGTVTAATLTKAATELPPAQGFGQ